MTKIHCYGVIALYKEKGAFYTFLVKHQKGHWGFPKGHPEITDASVQDTAKREFLEETGLKIDEWIDIPPLSENYVVQQNLHSFNKQVVYFLAWANKNQPIYLQPSEIVEGAWVSLEEAIKIVSFNTNKQLIQKVKTALEKGFS